MVVGDLKDRIKGDRMTLGLKQTRGMGGGSTAKKLEDTSSFKARGKNSSCLFVVVWLSGQGC